MNESSPALAEDWREQVRLLGKRAFENQEMLRLGFVTQETMDRLSAESGVTPEQYAQAVEEVRQARQDVQKLTAQIEQLQDVERAIAEIRASRIARVKAERARRKEEKERVRAERAQEIANRRRTAPTFLGRGVSDRLQFQGGDPQSVAARGLPVVTSFAELADALELTPEHLQWLTYERAAGSVDHYSRFEIPKRNGGIRLISSPKPAMRTAQTWIRERILSHLEVHSAATAFRPGISIVDNARRHAQSEIVVRLDIQHFFPSISFVRVRGYFESLGYNPGVSSVLALVCTDAPRVQVKREQETYVVALKDRSLPQGACTSPDLANLIAQKLDRRLVGLAQKGSWRYTRYADDLVFSSSNESAAPHRLVRSVTSIAVDEGFTINRDKTRIMRAPNRQTVTGLVVNKEVVLSRRDRKRIRAFFHRCETQGLDQVSVEMGKDARSVARGYYAWMHMVSPQMADEVRRKHPWV